MDRDFICPASPPTSARLAAMPFPYPPRQRKYNGPALVDDTWLPASLLRIASESKSRNSGIHQPTIRKTFVVNSQRSQPSNHQTKFRKLEHPINCKCQHHRSAMAPTSPRIPVRVRSRSPTLTAYLDENADGTTLIDTTQHSIPGSPLKNEIRPDSSCSNKVDDGAPRPIYHVTQLAPPSHPKIHVSIFACHPANDGRFLLGRLKDTGSGQHQRWTLPTSVLQYEETFEHAALRILDRQVTMHAAPATAALLSTTQTVPTDVLPNEGQHTVTVFMGLWVKEPIDLTMLSNDRQPMEWRWVSWENMSIESKSFDFGGQKTKKKKAKMTLTEFYDLVDPLKQLKWLHYNDDFHPVEELKSKIACNTPAQKSDRHCCSVQ